MVHILSDTMNENLISKVKETIENPDVSLCSCLSHKFYIKKFRKKQLLVYASKMDTGNYVVSCFGYLE